MTISFNFAALTSRKINCRLDPVWKIGISQKDLYLFVPDIHRIYNFCIVISIQERARFQKRSDRDQPE